MDPQCKVMRPYRDMRKETQNGECEKAVLWPVKRTQVSMINKADCKSQASLPIYLCDYKREKNLCVLHKLITNGMLPLSLNYLWPISGTLCHPGNEH